MVKSRPPSIKQLKKTGKRHVRETDVVLSTRGPSSKFYTGKTLKAATSPSANDNGGADAATNGGPVEPNAPPKQKQGMSSRLEPFMQELPKIQGFYLKSHAHPFVGKPCTFCSPNTKLAASHALYRCIDCFLRPPACKLCLLQHHHQQPFHRTEVWNGKYFERQQLSNLGLVVHFGHHGSPCSGHSFGATPRALTVCASNGIHEIKALYCACLERASRSDQLFESQLFPSTLGDPKSCFTFEVLDQYHIHACVSKKAAYDYFRGLLRLSDNVFPDDVSDLYRQFQLVMRIHRHLAAARRSGQAHGMDKLVSHRPLGQTRVLCPACPEPGFNVPWRAVLDCTDKDRAKYTLFIDTDGTFNMPRLAKKDDPDDVALNGGSAIFVEESKYQAYMLGQTPETSQSTCNDLKMVKLQNLKKFKNCVVAGVACIGCTRHGLFIKMSDLPGGERFCCVDYALAEALKDVCWWWEKAQGKGLLKLGYDLWCQYKINLFKRFQANKAWFPGLDKVVEEIEGIIGPVHIMNHVERCMTLYSANTTPNVGHLVVDMLEQRFSETKITGGSTKHMNSGHRHDTLDDFHNFWNWQKVTGLGKSICSQYVKARKLYFRLNQAFEQLTDNHSSELTEKWKSMYDAPRPKHDAKNPTNLFKSQLKPTTNTTQAVLSAQLAKSTSPASNQKSKVITAALSQALKVELEMFDVGYLAKGDDADNEALASARTTLYPKVVDAVKRLRLTFPSLAEHSDNIDKNTSVDPQAPERYSLPLPSHFNNAICQACDAQAAADIELDLRKTLALDALEQVRLNVLSHCANSKLRYNEIHGQYESTRAQKFLRDLNQSARREAHRYNCIRSHMISLGLSKDSRDFRQLDARNDLYIKDPSKPRQPGDTQRPDPWYWSEGMPDGVERADWVVEMHRVKWFKDRADVERWREEVAILEAEAERIPAWHAKTADNWTALAQEETSPERRAYAHKQANVHLRLQTRFLKEWDSTQKTLEKALINKDHTSTPQPA